MRHNDRFREVKIGMERWLLAETRIYGMSLLMIAAANAIRREAVPAIVPACYREEVRFRS